MRRIITIELDDKTTKIGIIDSILGYRSIKHLKNIKNEEIRHLSNNYIESLTKYINNTISKHLTPFMSLMFTLQNENVINRNLKIIKPQDERDIKDLIKYELKKFIPINLDNYVIKFVVNNVLQNEIEVQVILFPKSTIEICKEISNLLKIKPKKICVNFNVLQNLISKNIIKIENGENLILEIKHNIINLNVVKDKHIIESYSLNKSSDLNRYIESKLNSLNKIYIYGIKDENIINMISNIMTVEEIEINQGNMRNENNYRLNDFINNIGMIY